MSSAHRPPAADGPWKELYRLEGKGRVAMAAGYVLLAILLLALAAMFGFAVWLGLGSMRATGGFGPFCRSLYHDHGCGTVLALVVLVLVYRRARFFLAHALRSFQDWLAPVEVWTGEVEELREQEGYRGIQMCLLVFKGRVFFLTRPVFEQLSVGRTVRAEVKPHAPTLLRLELKD